MVLSEWPGQVSLTALMGLLFILWWRSGWKFSWLSALGRGLYNGFHYLPWRRKRVDYALAFWQSSMLLGQRVTKVHQGQVGMGLTAHEMADLDQQVRELQSEWENSPNLRSACKAVVKMRCTRKALNQCNPFELTPSIVRFKAAEPD